MHKGRPNLTLAGSITNLEILIWNFIISENCDLSNAKRFSNFFLIYGMAIALMFFNSTLNPFLFCWKISEVRQAVKQTIRQAICYA